MIISKETGTKIGRFSLFYVLLEGCNRLSHKCNRLHCIKCVFPAFMMCVAGYNLSVTDYTVSEILFPAQNSQFQYLNSIEMLMHVIHNRNLLFLT